MNVLTLIGVVLTALAALAGGVGYFKAGVSKATIELYKEDNEALRARLTTLETQVESDQTKIKNLEDANRFLSSVVTQSAQIASLHQKVDRILSKVEG